eukprot:TRINITY_DN19442_c0_g2_i2.p1 TRINITY_DN19442_c0_g2~~TRINITY_DN19442_c0_g2_i2.p1  ORF type:complete len:348 (-),score=65.53 TRINITY_DN19442_c0_g2_i2:77-1120(-)
MHMFGTVVALLCSLACVTLTYRIVETPGAEKLYLHPEEDSTEKAVSCGTLAPGKFNEGNTSCHCLKFFEALVNACNKGTTDPADAGFGDCQKAVLRIWKHGNDIEAFNDEQMEWVFKAFLEDENEDAEELKHPVFWMGFSHRLGTRALMDDVIKNLPGCQKGECVDIERKETRIGDIMREGGWYRSCHKAGHDDKVWMLFSAAFSHRQQQVLNGLMKDNTTFTNHLARKREILAKISKIQSEMQTLKLEETTGKDAAARSETKKTSSARAYVAAAVALVASTVSIFVPAVSPVSPFTLFLTGMVGTTVAAARATWTEHIWKDNLIQIQRLRASLRDLERQRLSAVYF